MATDAEPTETVTDREPAPGPSPEAQRLAEVVARNREVLRLAVEHAEQANAARAAKKRWVAAQRELSRLIAGMTERLSLFDRPNAAGPVAPAADVWRSVAVDVLCTDHGLPRGVVVKLEEFGLDSIGKLADWTDGGQGLTDVPGVGAASAEKIGLALVSFWEARRPPEGGDPGGAEPTAVEGAFAALLSVGHTEAQARRLLDRVAPRCSSFRSVADVIDAVYLLPPESPGDPGPTNGEADGEPSDWMAAREAAETKASAWCAAREAEARDAAGRAATRSEGVS